MEVKQESLLASRKECKPLGLDYCIRKNCRYWQEGCCAYHIIKEKEKRDYEPIEKDIKTGVDGKK